MFFAACIARKRAPTGPPRPIKKGPTGTLFLELNRGLFIPTHRRAFLPKGAGFIFHWPDESFRSVLSAVSVADLTAVQHARAIRCFVALIARKRAPTG